MNIENSKTLRTILVIAGLIAAGIGGAILFKPVAFYGTYGIGLGGSISLLNEIRAPGGALLASGIVIMLGAFVARLTFTSAVVAALIYLTYGASRFLSMAMDGIPVDGLVQAAVLEIAIGLVCVFALARYREIRPG